MGRKHRKRKNLWVGECLGCRRPFEIKMLHGTLRKFDPGGTVHVCTDSDDQLDSQQGKGSAGQQGSDNDPDDDSSFTF
jgi:hypothetical protein